MATFQRLSWIFLLAAVAAVPTVVGTVPFGPQLTLSPFNAPAAVLLCTLAGLSALAGAVATLGGISRVRYHPLLVALGVLLLLVVAATVASLDPAYSLYGDGDDLNGLLVYLACGLLVIAVMMNCTSSSRLRAVTSTVIYSGLFVAGVALLQQLIGVDPYNTVLSTDMSELGWLIHQGASTLGNPNFTGNYLVVPAVLASYRALFPGNGDRQATIDRVAAIALLLALVLTLTRGAWLGVGVGLVLMLAIMRKRSEQAVRLPRAAIVAGMLAIVFLLLFAGPELWRRVMELVSGGRHGLGGRTLVWGEAIDIIKAHPFLGVGPAAFRLGWYAIRDIAGLQVGAGAIASDAHSYPLMLAATAGVPAVLSAIALFVGTLVQAGRRVWNASTRVPGDYLAWLAAVAALAVSLLGAMMTTPLLMLAFLGVGVLLAPLARPVEHRVSSFSACVLTGVVALACIMGGTVQGVAHRSALRALTVSPAAVHEVADAPPWSGYAGSVAVQLEGEQILQATATSDPETVSRALAEMYEPFVARHPNDYEFPQWWATQLLIAGDLHDEPALLEQGLQVSEDALALYPNSLVLRTNRARALLDLGQPDAAAAELRGFEDADPTYEPAREVAAAISDALGE